MGSALQDRKTPEGDENNRKNRLETYSTIFLDSTGIEYARIEWVPPLRGAQPRISGFCFFAMIDWIPSEGRNPFRMGSEWEPVILVPWHFYLARYFLATFMRFLSDPGLLVRSMCLVCL